MNSQFFTKGIAAAALLFAAGNNHAGLQIPYAPDASTLHLWHLDETTGLELFDAVTTNPITLTNIALPNVGVGPYTNSFLGAPSFAGMGTSVSGLDKNHVLHGGAFVDVAEFSDLETGAFTFEAIVKFSINPLGTIDAELVCGDNGLGLPNRGWQFRVFNGVLEWNLLAGNATDNGFKSPLPATGPNAAIVGPWYHVAVTYTGEAPNNGDTPQKLTFYWTLLDANRNVADKLGEYTMTRPLNGAPTGVSQPRLGIAGSARNITTNPGNNEGLIGSIDEVRISKVARKDNEMAFKTSADQNPPVFSQQPPIELLVGWGQKLTIPALASGTAPLTYRWQLEDADVPNQSATTLEIARSTFANGGNYRLIVQNDFGSKTSEVSHVTIGAIPTGLANTGLNPDGSMSEGNIPDPNWTLYRSADPFFLGPNAYIFENSFPLQFGSPNGAFSPTNGVSMWLGAGPNTGGIPASSPAGSYIFRSRFLIDSADPATVKINGTLWVNGTVSDIIVNGQSTGTAIAPGGTLYAATYSVTNGFVAGWNTLDFVVTQGAGTVGFRTQLQAVGQSLAPGKPAIIDEPDDQTVRAGAEKAAFNVAALGRPGLSYQWFADDVAITGQTNRVLNILTPALTAQTTNIVVVVSNDSGSVTSRVAALKTVAANQAPIPAASSIVAFSGNPINLSLSQLVQDATDPDNDPITFIGADFASTNAATVEQINATLVYTGVADFAGSDEFSYTISDATDNAIGAVKILALAQPENKIAAPSEAVTFSLGLSSLPQGYTAQWQRNGANIANQTGSSLAINSVQVADAGAYTVVITDSIGQKWTNAPIGLTVGVLGTGTGLLGDYYSDITNGVGNFPNTPTISRVDPIIDFNWNNLPPDDSVTANYFMVRWHGQVQPLYSDLYTFYITSDDGSRLWVNNQLVANLWSTGAPRTASGTIALQANQKYDIVMEYFQQTAGTTARLSWSSDHQPQEVIPTTQLYPDTGDIAPRLTASANAATLTLNWSGTFTLQSASDINGPWTNVASLAVGPVTQPIPTTPGAKFYKLVNQP